MTKKSFFSSCFKFIENLFKKNKVKASSSKNQNNNNTQDPVKIEQQNELPEPIEPPRKKIALKKLKNLEEIINDFQKLTLQYVNQNNEVKKWISDLKKYVNETKKYIDNTNDYDFIKKCKDDIDKQIKIINDKIQEIYTSCKPKNSQSIYMKPINCSTLKQPTYVNYIYEEIDNHSKHNNNPPSTLSESGQPTAPERKKNKLNENKLIFFK